MVAGTPILKPVSSRLFLNATVYTSRATSCDVTQLLVVHEAWRDQKG
jgi:hypothetical protein